jgi:sugar lactone lactonase YvrE
MRRSVLAALVLVPAAARAGYEQPSYIDGGQSPDGRFVVTAAQVVDPKAGTKGGPPKPHPAHGPFRWTFTWKDTKTGEAKTFDAKGVQGGQVYAHLFVPPGGETFALFNHITLWFPEKSHGHGAGAINGERPGSVAVDRRTHEALSRRVVVYRKDGTVLKELAVNDFLTAAEWDAVVAPFNRAHWIVDYAPLHFKSAPRPGYACYRVSPDYTVLEFRVVAVKGAKDKTGRPVRVELTTGTILPADWKSDDKGEQPVRPFVGPDKLPVGDPAAREGYVPSLDPVRTEGKYAAPEPVSAPAAPTKYGPLALVKGGFTKLDTPAWLPADNCLIVSDVEPGKLFKVTTAGEVTEVREGRRGKAGPDGHLYGVFGGKLASWRPGGEPKVILDAAAGGKELSLNDIAVSPTGLAYFTTLKDPEKGRVSVVDVGKKTVAVAFDGEKETDLSNPNGVAVAPDGKAVFVGISNYKDRKKSGVYRFPLAADGSLDVAAGKAKKWADVPAPDGLAFGPDGHLYVTAGAAVAVVNPDGKKVGGVKVPKGSGTNLTFGGADGRTLYVTTDQALYAATPAP